MQHAKWTFVAVLLSVFLSGCREPREKLYPVTGKVTFQNTPVASGLIRFSCPQINIDMQALLDSEGEYEVVRALGPGLPEGTYTVSIVPFQDRQIGDMRARVPDQSSKIPPKYRELATSGIEFTVKPEANRFDIDMQPGS